MNSQPLTVLHEEDFETWAYFKLHPEIRWVFNKMEVAMLQNLHAGPAGTAPIVEGHYVSRPIYNIFGMGISAKKFFFDKSMTDAMNNHDMMEPGHFWCEWLNGPHYTIDYRKFDDGSWRCTSYMVGKHYDDTNLTKFKEWTKLNPEHAPYYLDLPLHPDHRLITAINVEMRQGKILEIHLRLGNDPFDHLPIGTRIVPIWEDMEALEGAEIMPNLYPDMELYTAHGKLSNIRSGYMIFRP